jgi:hypothetical protein
MRSLICGYANWACITFRIACGRSLPFSAPSCICVQRQTSIRQQHGTTSYSKTLLLSPGIRPTVDKTINVRFLHLDHPCPTSSTDEAEFHHLVTREWSINSHGPGDCEPCQHCCSKHPTVSGRFTTSELCARDDINTHYACA